MSFSVATSQQHYVVFSATVVLAQYAFVQHMEKVLIGLKAEHVMIGKGIFEKQSARDISVSVYRWQFAAERLAGHWSCYGRCTCIHEGRVWKKEYYHY